MLPLTVDAPAPAPADRLARTLRWARWPVLAVWLVLIVALIPFARGLAGRVNDTAGANLPANAASTRVAQIQEAATAGRPRSDPAVVVFVRESGLSGEDATTVAAARAAVANLAGRVAGVDPPGAVRRSPDGRAALFTVNVTAPAAQQANADTGAVGAIRTAVAAAIGEVDVRTDGRAGGGLRVAVTGAAAVTADGGVGNQDALLATSLSIVVIILLLVYRSPLLWIFPLLGTVGSLIVAKAVTDGLAASGVTVTSISTAILTVLVLGASTDYALLLVHRYREQLRLLPTPAEAMAVALRRTLPPVTASAATVVAAMLCLLAARSASLHGLGPVAAVSIASVLAAQLTLLPALLLLVGRPGFWPLIPRHPQAGGSGGDGDGAAEDSAVWRAVGERVARRPLAVAISAVALLGAAGAGLATLHVNNNPIGLVKQNKGSVAGQRMVTAHFPGTADPLTVLYPAAQAARVIATAAATPDVANVTAGAPFGGYGVSIVTLSVPPYGSRGFATIADLRDRLERAAPGAMVGGGPAVRYDTARAADRDTAVLIPLVLAVVLLIIMVLLRAVAAPLVLLLATVLGLAAAFGLASLLWHALGYPGVEAQLPLYAFVFLVALGVDYNIFLIARVREESRTYGVRAGTLRGLRATGGVITAAGVVLAATFAALSRLPYVPVAEVGSAIAIGVLIDTLLVRTVLVPAALLVLGERSWWPSRTTGGPATSVPATDHSTPNTRICRASRP